MKGLKILLGTILTLSIAFTSIFGINYKKADKVTAKEEYKGIITVWQVDGFEGGTGSRKQFLLKVARNFEKTFTGVLVMVTNYTADGVKENFEKGIFPDLISYSNGVDLLGYSQINVDRTVKGGIVGGRTYATAWARGGYVLISNPLLVQEKTQDLPLESVVVSQGDYTQPLAALSLQGIRAKQVETLKPMDAYVRFVGGKTPYMVGTQRDIVRLNNRGMEVIILPLTEYNDLYQYISVTATDPVKRLYAERFIEYLTSDKVQQRLGEICLFSPYIKVEYQNEGLAAMQNADCKNTVSAFTGGEQLKEMQEYSLLAVKGDQNALNKIKNLLV